MMRNSNTQTAGIACFGEILLRLAATHSELLLQTRTFVGHIGGAEANVAVALAQWGHSASVISVLPDNGLGHGAAGELRRYGVRTNAIQFRPGRMGLYFLQVGAGHRPSELLYDTCRWCQVDIYYDRLMPSRPDLMRVCLKCGILLLEADQKGAN